MKIAVVGSLRQEDEHLLGCTAILAGPTSRWLGAWYGSEAKVYREGFHLLEGVALAVGPDAVALASQVAGCPYPVVLVAYTGTEPATLLEEAVKLRREMGQAVHLFVLTPTFGSWMEVKCGAVHFFGGYPERAPDPAPPLIPLGEVVAVEETKVKEKGEKGEKGEKKGKA
jgi:hypothetical protein